jgi:hypothetical protein
MPFQDYIRKVYYINVGETGYISTLMYVQNVSVTIFSLPGRKNRYNVIN